MKKLNQYDTPETDRYTGSGSGFIELHQSMKSLEQRLAACRDTLACVNSSQLMHPSAHAAIREALTLTAPKQ
jgi:hypothetical protein